MSHKSFEILKTLHKKLENLESEKGLFANTSDEIKVNKNWNNLCDLIVNHTENYNSCVNHLNKSQAYLPKVSNSIRRKAFEQVLPLDMESARQLVEFKNNASSLTEPTTTLSNCNFEQCNNVLLKKESELCNDIDNVRSLVEHMQNICGFLENMDKIKCLKKELNPKVESNNMDYNQVDNSDLVLSSISDCTIRTIQCDDVLTSSPII